MTRAYDVNDLNAGQLVECMTLALAIGNLALPANTTIVRADKELCTRHSSQGLFFGKLVHEKKRFPFIPFQLTRECQACRCKDQCHSS